MWEGVGALRETTRRLCSPCGDVITTHTVVPDRHTREPKQWLCERCHTYTGIKLPFSPIESPDGREQIAAALKTMAIYAPILLRVDQDHLYAVTRRFFNAGWSVKDLLHAIDFRPDQSSHETAALNVRDRTEIVLGRIQTRLREWVWRDRYEDDKGSDIMPGPYTSMRQAMGLRHEEQKVRAFSREIEWAEQARLAADARRRGTPALVRQELAIAQELARHFKQDGNAREAAALAAQAEKARGRPLNQDARPAPDRSLAAPQSTPRSS